MAAIYLKKGHSSVLFSSFYLAESTLFIVNNEKLNLNFDESHCFAEFVFSKVDYSELKKIIMIDSIPFSLYSDATEEERENLIKVIRNSESSKENNPIAYPLL